MTTTNTQKMMMTMTDRVHNGRRRRALKARNWLQSHAGFKATCIECAIILSLGNNLLRLVRAQQRTAQKDIAPAYVRLVLEMIEKT